MQTVLPCSVRLTRVTPEEIAEACRPRPRPVPVQPVWEPPASVQGVLWRPTRSLGRPGPWRTSDQTGARSATSTLTAAAAAARGSSGASGLRGLRPRGSLPAVTTRAGTARDVSDTTTQDLIHSYSLPPGLSITPRRIAPRPQSRATPVPLSRGPVWRPTLRGAGGAVLRPALVRGRGVRFPVARGVPRGVLKPLRAPTPSRPPIGKELRDNDTVVIDLCSSSDEEGDPPPAVPPPPRPPPPPRIVKLEAGAASPAVASTNGSGWQSKNAHSHWSRSCGGLANGVSSCASLDAGLAGDCGGSSEERMAAAPDNAAVPLIRDSFVTSPCADVDSRTIGAERRHTVVGTHRDISCDLSECGLSVVSSAQLLSCSWKEPTLSSAVDSLQPGPHSLLLSHTGPHASTAGRHRAASEHGCEGRGFGVGVAPRSIWTVSCHAA